ncbi:hypothetical protein CI109_103732 [Kwoniella shandongensis]|uniref:Uncharacterized protein n=1 Tax=Kwoniella shandongensis TaxID=1734106 RepID=A0A5M6C7Z8_9TREE|nr:uncharacterized protein CI109_000573 [Kwoniella shandongensis]KAA5531001.1 hypothetical protein CI109_000573 [Kwoniella shandongensis]
MNGNFWTTAGVFASTPEMLDESGRDDFFQLEPPTPRNPSSNSQAHSSYVPSHSASTGPSFHPVQSHHSLRSYRSTSSLGWSTTTTASEPTSISDEESLFASSPALLPTSLSPNLTPSGTKPNARIPSLSIDPRLFAPPHNSARGGEGVDGGETIVTARPKSSKGRGGKSANKVDKESVVGRPSSAGKKRSSSGELSTKAKDDAAKKKISHARKQTPDHIPRPRNAFILFRKHVVDSKLIPASVEMRHQNVSIITAKMWSEAPPDQKAHFNELARIEKEEHLKKYPGYRYQPVYRRTNVIRRRVRKDEAEEEKCKSVAELLMKGKSGEELEEVIKEKINKGSEEEVGSSPSGRGEKKSSSRKNSQACELSKGALRALRAQIRQQQQSGEWSDISRSTSLVPSEAGASRRRGQSRTTSQSRSRQTSSVYETESPESCSRLEDDDDLMGDDTIGQEFKFGFAPSQLYHPGFSVQAQILPQFDQGQGAYWLSSGENTSYGHPDMSGGTFSQAIVGDVQMGGENGGQQQHFEYTQNNAFQPTHHPQHISIASSSEVTGQSLDSSPPLALFYPQPKHNTPSIPASQGSYLTHDTALPFSPSVTQFTFPTSTDEINYDLLLQEANGRFPPPPPPMSARWDKAHLLPPSSEVPLEDLPFDDSMFLGDFEAALAQADEVVW